MNAHAVTVGSCFFALTACTTQSNSGGPNVYRIAGPEITRQDMTEAVNYIVQAFEASDCEMSYNEFHGQLQKDGSFNASEKAKKNGSFVELEQLHARSIADEAAKAMVKKKAFIVEAKNPVVYRLTVGKCA